MKSKEFLQHLIGIEALKFGKFKLASGEESEFYLDLRYLPAYPELFQQLLALLDDQIVSKLDYDVIIGIPSAGTPFATGLAIQTSNPQQLLRKKPKEHGLRRQIEGPNIGDKRILVVDDLISSGFSKNFAIDAILKEGGIIEDVVVLVNRSEGKGQEWAKDADVTLHSLFNISAEEILKLKH